MADACNPPRPTIAASGGGAGATRVGGMLGGCVAWLLHGATAVVRRRCEQAAALHEWKVAPAVHLLLEEKFRALRCGCERLRLRGSGGRLGFLGLNRKNNVKNQNRNA